MWFVFLYALFLNGYDLTDWQAWAFMGAFAVANIAYDRAHGVSATRKREREEQKAAVKAANQKEV
jgi:hypothetical protein